MAVEAYGASSSDGGEQPPDHPTLKIEQPDPLSKTDVARANDEALVHGMSGHGGKPRFWGLALGSLGVVFGDIGTSPLYAMREALSHSRHASSESAVLGVVSLVLWALILIVTVKYVFFLMRADNKGEGGTLALMALAQRALASSSTGRRSVVVFALGVCGAARYAYFPPDSIARASPSARREPTPH
jgi:hypothetical protein